MINYKEWLDHNQQTRKGTKNELFRKSNIWS